MFRFVHLSDIHFGQEKKDKTTYVHEDVRNELIRDVQSQAAKHGKADGILVTGDIAYSGKEDEFDKAAKWLDALTNAAGCSKKAVLLIPGNHDVDIAGIDVIGMVCHEGLRQMPLDQVSARLVELGTLDLNEHPLHKKMRAYREFAEQYGCDFFSSERPIWEKDFSKNGQHVLRFLGLNSVQVSNKDDEPDKMVLGNPQFIFQRNVNVEYVILIHHPFKWFRDRAKAEEFLRSRARVMMFGHEHLAAVEKLIGQNDHEYLMIDSGATNPPGELEKYSYAYNWLNFTVVETPPGHSLSVRIAPRVWSKSDTAFIADHNRMRLNADESKDFVLSCPEFQTMIAQDPTPPTAPLRPEGETTLNLSANEADNFEKLRFFFWRYLDWRDRLNVLVRADVLPASANRPIPQTMERMALSRARDNHKLGLIWDETMKIVPELEREENPFKNA